MLPCGAATVERLCNCQVEFCLPSRRAARERSETPSPRIHTQTFQSREARGHEEIKGS